MTFREKLAAYEAGTLNDEESREIKKVLDQQEAIWDYLSAQAEIPELTDETSAGRNQENNRQSEQNPEEKFSKELSKGIRRAFTKMGVTVGAVLLALILFIEFALPHVVDAFYYNPGTVVGTEGPSSQPTNQMSRDMAVYSELFLPNAGVIRDNVSVSSRGYGAYDIVINQNMTYAGGRLTSVAGRIEKGKLTLYDNNTLALPSDNVFEWTMNNRDVTKRLSEQIPAPETTENGGTLSYHVSSAGTPEESLETIRNLSDQKTYKAYISLDKVLTFDEANTFQKEWSLDGWMAVVLGNDGTVAPANVGFCLQASPNTIAYDEDMYPLLTLRKFDGTFVDLETEEQARTHLESLLRYYADQTEFQQLMGMELTSAGLDEMLSYLEENGVQVYGLCAVCDKATLLKLMETGEVYSIYVEEWR